MFRDCNALDDLVIPGSIEVIEQEAFYNCDALENITFNVGLKCIGERAFAECVSIKYFELPDGLEVIDSHAFESCTALRTVILPTSVSELGIAVFENSGVQTIIADESWRDYVEKNYILFQSLDSEDGNQSINNSFDAEDFLWKKENGGVVITQYIGNENIVFVPDTIDNMPVQAIGDSAFADLNSLQEVILPDGLIKIGAYAFMNCQNLGRITVPSSVQEFGKFAFNNDLNLVMIVSSGSYAEEYAASKYILTAVE